MDDDLRRELFDPATTRRLLRARRRVTPGAPGGVVPDDVWTDVVRLLRWATADPRGRAALQIGAWQRLAAACAEVLLRLPARGAGLGPRDAAGPDDARGAAAVASGAARLAALLRFPGPVPLSRVAAEVDALGAAAVGALAEQRSWPPPAGLRPAPAPAGRRRRHAAGRDRSVPRRVPRSAAVGA